MLCGVGINDADYVTRSKSAGINITCPYYVRWREMLNRCYSSKFHQLQPTYKDCTVCVDWLTFSSFKWWMESQDWVGKELDKDLLVLGNKVYGPSTCVFIDRSLNCLLTDRKLHRGKYPLGVYYHKQSGTYRAQCSTGVGKQTTLGNHKTPEEANLAYRKFKSEYIIEVSENYREDHKIYEAIIRYAKEVRDGDKGTEAL